MSGVPDLFAPLFGLLNLPLMLFGLATTPLELLSFLLALATVVLNIRQNHWAWLFSIISSATYAAVFLDAKLYGDMGLQLVFIAISIWGWWQWLPGAATDAGTPLAVSRLTRGGWLLAGVGWLAGFLLLSYFLKTWTDTDVPHADGFLTAGSLLGQLLLARKRLENWHVWIAVDLLYVALYLYKHLVLTALLYAIFVAMAVAGLRAWQRAGQSPAPQSMVLE